MRLMASRVSIPFKPGKIVHLGERHLPERQTQLLFKAWDARGVDYRDLFPTEPSEDGATCATVGVLASVCTVIDLATSRPIL